MAEDHDEGSVAIEVADMLTELDEQHGADGAGWTFNGLDIGEIEVTTPAGSKFRFSVERVESFDL